MPHASRLCPRRSIPVKGICEISGFQDMHVDVLSKAHVTVLHTSTRDSARNVH